MVWWLIWADFQLRTWSAGDNRSVLHNSAGLARGAAPPSLAVVIPAHNEGERIADVLRRTTLACAEEQATVFVVDDGSHDATAAIAKREGARVLRHRINLGKGAALLTGAEAACAAGFSFIVVIDADGQHDPADIPRLLRPLRQGDVDLVLTRRQFSREMPLPMRLGNRLLSQLFRVLFGMRVLDTQCGLRAFTAPAFQQMRWSPSGYAVETEMLVRASRTRLRVTEMDIKTVYHDRYKGTTPLDGMWILGRMLRWWVA